ncbi:MAG: hypothetical protein KDE58_40770 [Caldilineaceae bacterium]|nr:hypothetical protein [Caldilineaceae bacterium]
MGLLADVFSYGDGLKRRLGDHAKAINTLIDERAGYSGAALDTTATLGFAYLPTCAGAPTGTPELVPTGAVASVYDTTNNRLYVYNGAWKSVALS